jgi:hypothetical protein
MCPFVTWHPLPATRCHAVVTAFIDTGRGEWHGRGQRRGPPFARALFGRPERIRTYMRDMLEGLQYLHAKGVMYRGAFVASSWANTRMHE